MIPWTMTGYHIPALQWSEGLESTANDFNTIQILKRGKFLLLIAGDGIKENASGIAEFLSSSAYLNFTLAMIELNIYKGKDIGQLIIPHTIVKTTEISKMTINIHDGLKLIIDDDYDNSPDVDSKEMSSEKEFYINLLT